MPGKIFISYRRDDDPSAAARVRDGLAAKFGKSALFMDVDNLLAGQRFDDELARALTECDVLVAIMGAKWMDVLAAKTAARERDYVREEIAAALRRRIVVIPVRVGRDGSLAPLPRPADLPDDIGELVQHQKHDVAHERFGRDVADLAEAIAMVRRARRRPMPTRKLAIAGITLLVLGGSVVASRIGLLSWTHDEKVGQRNADATAAESKRLADLDNQLKQETAARQKAETESKRLAAAAVQAPREADAKRKADSEASANASAIAEDAERKRLDAEVKRKVEDQVTTKAAEAERKRLADVAELAQRELDAKQKTEAEAAEKARAAEVDRQRVALAAKRRSDEEAAARLSEEERQLSLARDHAAWAVARESSSLDSLQAYMETYPDGQHIGQARNEFRTLVARTAQAMLQRIGCYTGEVDGKWGVNTRSALRDYARYSKVTMKDGDEPSRELLGLLAQKTERICPLQCGDDEEAFGEQCRKKFRPKPDNSQTTSSKSTKSEPSNSAGLPKCGGYIPMPSPGTYACQRSGRVCDAVYFFGSNYQVQNCR